jgi:hypothetical protein
MVGWGYDLHIDVAEGGAVSGRDIGLASIRVAPVVVVLFAVINLAFTSLAAGVRVGAG